MAFEKGGGLDDAYIENEAGGGTPDTNSLDEKKAGSDRQVETA